MKSKFFNKVLVICSLALISFGTANAQLRFGPILGANFSNITGDLDSDGMLIGGHLGLLVNFSLTDNIQVEPQVLYSMQGAQFNAPFIGDYDLKLNYIQVPIWVRYQTEGGFNLQAGPYLGLLLSAKAEDTDVKDQQNSFDFGVGGGIGYQMGSGLGFAANYNIGLNNIADSDIYDAKNTLIRVSVNYMLGGD